MKTTFAILLTVALAACGGGGSDNSGTNGNEPGAVDHPTESFCPCIPSVPASAPAP